MTKEEVVRHVVEREQTEARLGSVSTPMPQYQCHKKVWALKIEDVIDPTRDGNESDGTLILRFEEYTYSPIRISHDYVRKHNPTVGGYYVVYDDGYKSFSPAKAFEEGYTRL